MTTSSRISRAPSSLVAALVAVLALGLLGGCGSDHPKVSGKPVGEPTTKVDGTKVQTVKLPKHGFSFELPAGWSKIDRQGALNTSSPIVKNMAEHLGVSPERLVQTLESSVEVLAVTDQGADSGFLENVNVVPLPPGQSGASQLRLQIAAVAGKVSDTSSVQTPIGSGTTITYSLASSGIVVQGKALAVGTSSRDQVLITVSAHRASVAAAEIEAIRSSLAKL